MDRSRIILSVATLACLLPWINRAVHMDDPLFLWSAERILSTPGDFYGGQLNWSGTVTPTVDNIQNPPLVSFYLAGVAALTGFSEPWLHLAMLVPTLVAVLATWSLARRLDGQPLLAGAILIASPAFLVSSTSLMCDVPMVAFWLVSLALWLKGIDEHRTGSLIAAGVLMGCCGLTKYFGVALLPLCLVYGLAARRRVGWWCLALLIPLCMFAAFELYTNAMYGRPLIWHAAGYARSAKSALDLNFANRGLLALCYAGAGAAPLILWMPWLWSWRANLLWLLVAAALAGWWIYQGALADFTLRKPEGVVWVPVLHLTIFGTMGLQCCALTVSELWRKRDPHTLLITLWMAGTLIFCGWFNWTINCRAILPLLPALAILISRRVQIPATVGTTAARWRWSWSLPVGIALALSLLLCYSDYQTAAADRTAANALADKYLSSGQHSRLWFEGQWGYQYYLERRGAHCIDYRSKEPIVPGQVIAIAMESPTPQLLLKPWIHLDPLIVPIGGIVNTHCRAVDTSFYSEILGPLPYRFGPVPPRTYEIFIPFEAGSFMQ